MRTQINNTLLFAAIFLAGAISKTYAQSAPTAAKSPKNVRIGFKFSPNFTFNKVMEGNVKNNGLGLGFSYGMMLDFNLGNNPNYWISTELLITNQPSKLKSTDTLYNSVIVPGGASFTNTSFDYRLQYVQIPVTLKLKTNEIGRLTYYGQFGFAPSILIQNKLTTTADQSFYKTGTTQSHSPNSSANDALDFDGQNDKGSYRDDVSPIRLPLILGAGIEGKISGNTTFIAGLRLDNSFTDMSLDKKIKVRNNYLAINLGIFF